MLLLVLQTLLVILCYNNEVQGQEQATRYLHLQCFLYLTALT